MKFIIFFAVAYVVVTFEVCDAYNLNFLQDFMHTNLSRPPPPQSIPTTTSTPSQIEPSTHPDVAGAGFPGIVNDSAPPAPTPTLPPVCPREVKISWQLRPPFTLENNASEGSQERPIAGIFHQALDFALGECCVFYRGNKPIMRYLTMTDNQSDLHHAIFSDFSSLVFPIQDNLYIGGGRRYINVLDSPGVVVIQRETSHSTGKGGRLFKAILETWPIVVLSLLMSSLAGIVIWMLVSLDVIK